MQPQLKITTALILAAGFGTRMQELTHHFPKSLLPLANSNLLDLHLLKLKKAGIKKVIINLHYQGDLIKQHLAQHPPSELEILFSEEKVILGTGGAIAHAEKLFKDETILITNSDILSDLSLKNFILFHQQRNPIASMAILPSKNTQDYNMILYDKHRNLSGFLKKKQKPNTELKSAIFMGYQILSPQVRLYLKPVFSSIIEDFYRKALHQQKQIAVYVHTGEWIDIGTKAQYQQILDNIESGEISLTDFV